MDLADIILQQEKKIENLELLLSANVNSLSKKYHTNLLINGGFEVWQRGDTFNSIANTVYTADRWRTGNSGCTINITKNTSIIDKLCKYSMKYVITGAGTLADIAQQIPDWELYKGQTISVTLRIKCPAVTRARVYVADGVGISWSDYNAGTDFETITLTHTVSASATTIVIGIGIDATVTGTYYIGSVMCVLGDEPVDYVPRSEADELIDCMRYCEAGRLAFNSTRYTSGANLGISYNWKVKKRIAGTPTLTFVGGNLISYGPVPLGNTLSSAFTSPDGFCGEVDGMTTTLGNFVGLYDYLVETEINW